MHQHAEDEGMNGHAEAAWRAIENAQRDLSLPHLQGACLVQTAFPRRIPGSDPSPHHVSITSTTSTIFTFLTSSHLICHRHRNFCSLCKMSHSPDDQSSTNYKEAFSLFDKRGTGRVSLESLGDLLRACGQNPTLGEISDLEKNIGGDFDFEAFSRVLSRPGGFRDPGEPEEYCRGFQVFDKDLTGVIGVGQLRYSKSIWLWMQV